MSHQIKWFLQYNSYSNKIFSNRLKHFSNAERSAAQFRSQTTGVGGRLSRLHTPLFYCEIGGIFVCACASERATCVFHYGVVGGSAPSGLSCGALTPWKVTELPLAPQHPQKRNNKATSDWFELGGGGMKQRMGFCSQIFAVIFSCEVFEQTKCDGCRRKWHCVGAEKKVLPHKRVSELNSLFMFTSAAPRSARICIS